MENNTPMKFHTSVTDIGSESPGFHFSKYCQLLRYARAVDDERDEVSNCLLIGLKSTRGPWAPLFDWDSSEVLS